MERIVVPAQKRSVSGSRGATDCRRQGLVPGILYGGKEPVAIALTAHDIRHAIYTPEFHRIELDLEGEKVECILKEVQFHPVTEEILHLDFLRLVEGRKVKVDVPLRLTGTSVGLKAGGKLIQKVRQVKIKAAPENLVHELLLDVSELNLGQSIRVRDIKAGPGIEILNSPGIPVGSVEIPRVLKSVEAEAAKAAPAAAGLPAAGEAEGEEDSE